MSAHGRNHWIKLYVEMNHDPKIGLLTDDLKWRFTSVLLLAGEIDDGGFLPELDEMSWTLRIAPETLAGQLRTLAQRALVELRQHPHGGERWFISKFAERQAASTNAERQKQWRRRNTTNDSVTKRYGKVTPETETEAETETEGEIARLTPPAKPKPKKSPPPPVVKTQIADRTPGGNGYHPPEEPEPVKREPGPEVKAIGEMANAITDVTGISARLNWGEVGGFAEELWRAGYTPQQVRAHYGRDPMPGAWHWYTDDWRGKKGDKPRTKEIRETIAGATEPQAAPKAKRRIDPILQALALFPNPQPNLQGG